MDKFDETVYKNQYSKQHYANIGIKIGYVTTNS